jgi:two-component system, sensor histidine kinase and response regulator
LKIGLFSRLSLRDRLRFLVLLASGLALLIFGAVYITVQTLAHQWDMVRDFSGEADRIASDAGPALLVGDDAAVDQALRALRKRDDVLVAAIYAMEGTVLAQHTRRPVSPPPLGEIVFGTYFERGELVHGEHILVGTRQLGAVHIRASPVHYQRQLWIELLIGSGGLVAAFAIAMVMSLWLTRRIASPIEQLTETAKRAAWQREYSLRADGEHDGAVSDLAHSFNEILRKMEASNDALRKRSDYFLSLFENALDLILVIGDDGNIRFANAAAERLLGYGASELLGRDLGALLTEPDVAADGQSLQRLTARAHEGAALEVMLQHADGSSRTHELTLTDLRHDPLVEGTVLISRDITDRKAMEEEARRSRQLLDAVFENIPSLLAVKDARTLQYVRVNKAAEELIGWSQAQLVGRTAGETYRRGEAAACVQTDERVIASGRVLDVHETVQTLHKGERMLHTRKLPIPDENGSPRYLLRISEDVTEQNAAAAALQVSEERYRTVVEHAADAFFLHDLEGRVLDVNQQACDGLGCTRSELLSLPMTAIALTGDGFELPTLWQALDIDVPRTLECLHRRKDGSSFPVEARLVLVAIGEERRVIVIARDISDRRRQEARLVSAMEAAEAANRAKSAFLANMSHEIRTPMNAVIGLTDLLLGTRLNATQAKYLKTIRASGDMLLGVIDDVLDFSKMEAGELVLEEIPFELCELLDNVLSVLGGSAQAKGIELAGAIDRRGETWVTGDLQRLRQVLLNLTANAIKFTHSGHVIVSITTLAETHDRLTLHVSVEDSGIGIAPEARGELFRPFSQVDASTSRQYGGSGLGLAISSHLVRAMGGEIALESEVGCGSTFSVELGLRRAHPPHAAIHFPSRLGTQELARLHGRSVLVAERVARCREVLTGATLACGMRVEGVGEPADALQRLRRQAEGGAPYEFMVLDLGFWAPRCYDMIERIRRDPALGCPRLVVLAPFACGADESRYALDGVALVRKPIQAHAVLGALASLLGGTAMPIAGPAAGAGVALPPPGRHGAVLVAEDNAAGREMLLHMLERLGYPTGAAADGPGALEAIARGRYGVLLLDCQMPGMDGYAVAEQVRAWERERGEKRLPIIAVTANASVQDRQRAEAAGMDDYLTKPVRLQQLAATLAKWMPSAPEPARPVDDVLDPAFWRGLDALSVATGAARQAAFLERLTVTFSEDSEGRLQAMQEALRTGNAARLAREAHAAKAGALQVGAHALAAVCERLEKAGRSGQMNGVERDLAALRIELTRAGAALEKRRERVKNDCSPDAAPAESGYH